MPFIGRQNFYFHNPNLSTIDQHAFQALAIDENRGAYEPTLWTLFAPEARPDGRFAPPEKAPVDRVEQRWFIGAHANVGGGYKNDPLSRLPLAWMKAKAEGLGLAFSGPVVLTGTEHLTAPTDSYAQFLHGAYRVIKLGQRYYRPIGMERRKVKGGWSYPVNEVIDASVLRRFQATEYRPQNLMTWGKGRAVDLSKLQGDQMALLQGREG